jgi:hypothetical protein
MLVSFGALPSLQNWPSCCPFIYHNIGEQIPAWNRSFVRFTYLIELLTIAGFFYNCLIVLIAIFARVGPGLNWWFISMLCLVMGVPLSWWLFYKSCFNSAQTDGATYSYMKTFLLIMIHIAWAAWMVIAAPNLGTFSAGEGLEGWGLAAWDFLTESWLGLQPCFCRMVSKSYFSTGSRTIFEVLYWYSWFQTPVE